MWFTHWPWEIKCDLQLWSHPFDNTAHLAFPHIWPSLTFGHPAHLAIPHIWPSRTFGHPTYLAIPCIWPSRTFGRPVYLAIPHICQHFSLSALFDIKWHLSYYQVESNSYPSKFLRFPGEITQIPTQNLSDFHAEILRFPRGISQIHKWNL